MTPLPEPNLRFHAALEEYALAQHNGKLIDRDDLLGRYPDVREQLLNYFTETANIPAPILTLSHIDEQTIGYGPPQKFDEVCTGTLDDYEVGEEIARGGMGVIVRAVHRPLRREVALKIMLADPATHPATAKRFLEEAQIASQLQHPGIAPVHEIGRVPDGRPFFAMKLIKGRTLAVLLAERVNPTNELPRFLQIFQQIAQTIAYAHSKGVIHRDLKPLNVMVGSFGEVQVMDWGLAKVLSYVPTATTQAPDEQPHSVVESDRSDELLTQAGSIMGTFAYMPPEQAKGEIDRIDRRADVFALGALLCEILTGQPPYGGLKEEIRARATLGDLDGVRAKINASGADHEISTLALHCLANEPNERPSDAGEVAATVAAYLANVAEKLRVAEIERATTAAKAAEQRKRRRLKLIFASVLVLTAFVGGGLIWWGQTQRNERRAALNNTIQVALSRSEQLQEQARTVQGTGVPQALEAHALLKQAKEKAHESLVAADHPLVEKRTKDDVSRFVKVIQDAEQAAEQRVYQAQREARFLEELAESRSRAGEYLTVQEQKKAGQQTVNEYYIDARINLNEQYRQAFTRLGIAIATAPLSTVIEQLQSLTAGDIRTQATLALYYWLDELHDEKQRTRLMQLLKAIDPDPWRSKFRTALRAKDKAKQLDATAKEMGQETHPAWNYVLLAKALSGLPQANASAIIELLQQGYLRYPSDTWINEALAQEYYRRSVNAKSATNDTDCQKALEHARAALAGRPNSLYLRARITDYLPEEEKLPWLRANMRLFPDQVELFAKLGDVMRQREDHPATIAAFQKAAELDLSPRNLSQWDRALEQGVDVRDRVRVWAEFTAKHPQNADGFHFYAKSLQANDDPLGMSAAFHKAHALEPTYARTEALTNTLQFEGKPRLILRLWLDYMATHPNDPRGLLALASAQSSLKDWDGTIKTLRLLTTIEADISHTNRLAKALKVKGDSAAAVQVLREFTTKHYENEFGFRYLGLLLHEINDNEGAIKALQTAVKWDETLDSMLELTKVLQEMGAHPKAIQLWRDYCIANPNSAQGHFHLGECLLQSKKEDEALVVYQKAVQLDATDFSLCKALSSLLQAKGEPAAARQVWLEYTTKNPADVLGFRHLGETLAEANDWNGAIAVYRKLVALELDRWNTLRLANALTSHNDHAGAITAWQVCLAKHPRDGEAHYALGRCYLAKNDLANALPCFLRGCESAGGAYRLTTIANELIERGYPNEARTVVNTFVARYPNNDHSYYDLAEVLRRLRDWDGAIQAYRKAIAISDKHYHTRELAATMREKGDDEGARQILRAFLAKEHEDGAAIAFEQAGEALAELNDDVHALKAFQKALELEPSADTTNRLALVYLQKNDPGSATRVLRDYTAKYPNDAEGHQHLGFMLALLKNQAEARREFAVALKLEPNDAQTLIRAAAVECDLVFKPLTALQFLERIAPEETRYRNGTLYGVVDTVAHVWLGTGIGNETIPLTERTRHRRQAYQGLQAHLNTLKTSPQMTLPQRLNAWNASKQYLVDELAFWRNPLTLQFFPRDEQMAWQRVWETVRKYRASLMIEQGPKPREVKK